jgi:hypothetical protein
MLPRLFAGLLLLAPTPQARVSERHARFWFLLGRTPVGVVDLRDEPAAGGRSLYRYESLHLFGRGAPVPSRRQVVEMKLGPEGTVAGAAPVSRWLWRRQGDLRCVPVFEETTGKKGEACIRSREGAVDRGTAMGQELTAKYGEGGLESLEVGQARFIRANGIPDVTATPFDDAIPVEGKDGPPGIVPAPPASPARLPGLAHGRLGVQEWIQLARRFREEILSRASGERGVCLELADALAREAGPSGEIVYGLHVEGKRAYPHAWVRISMKGHGPVEMDAALLEKVTQATHLEISTSRSPGDAGQVYLDLYAGKRRVVRGAQ